MAEEQVQQSQPQGKLQAVVFADFICPYSYIGQEQADQLLQDYDVDLYWRPHWLHPEIPIEGSPMPANVDPDQRKARMQWMKEMAPAMAERMRFPGKRQFSFLAFAGMEYAQDHGLAQPFRRAVFDALWVEGKDIGLVETLQQCAEKVGLPAEELGRELRQRPLLERTMQAVEATVRMGIHQTPTAILGRTAILGWHYYEVWQTALERQGYRPKVVAGGQQGTA